VENDVIFGVIFADEDRHLIKLYERKTLRCKSVVKNFPIKTGVAVN